MSQKPIGRTLRAQWLGQQLRRLREDRGLMLTDVALHLARDRSALSRYERGDWPIRRADAVALLDLYGMHEHDERAGLLQLAEDIWHTDHWEEDYRDLIHPNFVDYTWLESRAAQIGIYEAALVPGLLQTRKYAEAVIRGTEAPDTPEATVKRYVEFRMQRQEVLTKKGAPWVTAIIEEAALRRPVGGTHVAQAQLARLVQAVRTLKVEIRVLPTYLGAHPGVFGPFAIFAMPTPYPAVAFAENLGGRLYLEMPKAERFIDTYARLKKAALDPRESARLIAAIAEEIQ